MDDHKQVTGFGWMNDNQFYWGQYNLDEVNKLDPNGFQTLILKQQNLKKMPYIKKEKDQPVEDEVPTSFAITLFHVVFMYPSNITVISKISREIVYFSNIDKTKLLRGI